MFKAISAICALLVFSSCGFLSTKLTDDLVLKYISAYSAIKTVAPDAAKNMKAGGDKAAQVQEGKASFNKIEEAVKKAGFANFQEFMKVNTAVNIAFIQIQATTGTQKYNDMKSDGLETLDKAIADPSTPDDVRVALQKQREQTVKDTAKNEAMAGKVMGVFSKLGDSDNLKVVERHKDALLAAYTQF